MRWVAIAALVAVAATGTACGSSDNGPLNLGITVVKPCVKAGEQQTITTKVVKNAKVAYAVGYSDGFPHGTGAPAGAVDTQGVFHGVWNIPSDAPPGPVSVIVLAAAGKRTAKKPTGFKVAKPDGTCP